MKYRSLVPAGALAAALALTACAGPAEDDDAKPDAATSSAPTEATGQPTETAPPPEATSTAPESVGPSFTVTIKGSAVAPNAEEVSANPGEKIIIDFDTDRAGQLHVHSKPEQYVDFPAGASTKELVIKTPGTVEIEEHDSEAVVAVVTVK